MFWTVKNSLLERWWKAKCAANRWHTHEYATLILMTWREIAYCFCGLGLTILKSNKKLLFLRIQANMLSSNMLSSCLNTRELYSVQIVHLGCISLHHYNILRYIQSYKHIAFIVCRRTLNFKTTWILCWMNLYSFFRWR